MVLQYWYHAGRFFDITIDVVYLYHAFTTISVQLWCGLSRLGSFDDYGHQDCELYECIMQVYGIWRKHFGTLIMAS